MDAKSRLNQISQKSGHSTPPVYESWFCPNTKSWHALVRYNDTRYLCDTGGFAKLKYAEMSAAEQACEAEAEAEASISQTHTLTNAELRGLVGGGSVEKIVFVDLENYPQAFDMCINLGQPHTVIFGFAGPHYSSHRGHSDASSSAIILRTRSLFREAADHFLTFYAGKITALLDDNQPQPQFKIYSSDVALANVALFLQNSGYTAEYVTRAFAESSEICSVSL
jgi:hypothetical protein